MNDMRYSEPLVSIVIPIYNAEKSLERCLDSVLSQDYKNIEAILIDDGSRDSSPEICARYKSRNPERISIVRQENSGPSTARNRGIELSRGKYIAFVDSDDMVASNMISSMIEKAEENDADMAICAYWRTTSEGKAERTFALPEGLYANNKQKEILYSLLDEGFGDIRPYSWLRFTRKSVFEESGLRFSDRLYRSEDFHFWVRVHANVKKVYLLSQTPLYYYYENDASITHNHVNDYWKAVQFIYNDLKKNLKADAVVSKKLDMMLVRRSMIALNNASYCTNAKEAYQEINEIIRNEELTQIIKMLDTKGDKRFKGYRFLMSKGLKFVIVGKYMMRWLKSRK